MASRAERIDRTLPEILQGIAGNIQEIFRSEIRLAKVEGKDELNKAKRPAGLIGTGACLSLYGGGFVLLAAVFGLATIVATWMAALIVGVPLVVLGAIFISTGKKQMRLVNAIPPKTAESLKENMEWAKRQIR
jgi:hypothetical protein